MSRDDSRQPPPDLRTRICLTLPEAAAVMGVSERHLRSVRAQLPTLHVGNRVLVPVDGLREWVNARASAEETEANTQACSILDELGVNK